MSGGFGAGFLKGALISLIAAAAVSLLVPLKTPDPGRSAQVDLSTPAGSGFNAERADTEPRLPKTDRTRISPGGLRKPVAADPGGAAPAIDSVPAAQPDAAVTGQTGGLNAPAESPDSDRIARLENPGDSAPSAVKPALGMPTPVIENPIERIPVNRLPTIDAPTSENEAAPGIGTGSADDAAPARTPAAGLDQRPAREAAPAPNTAPPPPPPAPTPAPVTGVTPPPPSPAPAAAPDEEPDAADAAPAPSGQGGSAFEPAATLPPTATIIARANPPAAAPADPPEIGGLKRNRIPPASFPDKPLMSIILIDAGADGVPARDLMALTIPISIALDPGRPASRGLSESYASAGFEVLALAPDGAERLQAAESAADIDAALSGVFSGVPRAVGLLDRPDAAIQKDARLTDQVIASLSKSGYGLLTYDIGLNAADQKAGRAGVPSATVFRILDGGGESGITIKRYLDRAVLEAGKVGHVVVLGHSRPETVAALISWAVGAKSASVSLAPVSTTLLAR